MISQLYTGEERLTIMLTCSLAFLVVSVDRPCMTKYAMQLQFLPPVSAPALQPSNLMTSEEHNWRTLYYDPYLQEKPDASLPFQIWVEKACYRSGNSCKFAMGSFADYMQKQLINKIASNRSYQNNCRRRSWAPCMKVSLVAIWG